MADASARIGVAVARVLWKFQDGCVRISRHGAEPQVVATNMRVGWQTWPLRASCGPNGNILATSTSRNLALVDPEWMDGLLRDHAAATQGRSG